VTTQLATITSVGGLLPPDLLARIVAGDRDVPGIGPSDYGLDDGITLREAISRAWNRLVPAWRAFVAARDKLPKDDPATTVTREKFLQPLFEELRFGRVAPRAAYQVDDRTYAITHAWGEVPIHMLGAGVSLDTKQAKVAGAAKSSPHGLVQDFLNRSKAHLWAIVTNGLSLRLLRDHHSLTTQAYVDVDLEAMFEGNHYADFALAWMVFHQSRFEAARPEDCWLEKWFTLARDQGVAALDDLRGGVERAIEGLGRGFLRHKDNAALRDELRDGGLDKQEYYRELLRLVYRCIFLFSTEERDVLLDPAAEESAKERYRRFYATRRLRELAGTMRGGPHGDLWQGLMTVMRGLDGGCAPLALPALGSFLWSPSAVPHLGAASLANEDLLTAMRELSYLSRNGKRFPVAWRTVAADELGGIYEGLLELHPSLDVDAGAFELETAAGHERKKTGSYYTPTSLVDCLLDTALDPVVDAAVKGKSRADAEAALLALKVVDPACGSGALPGGGGAADGAAAGDGEDGGRRAEPAGVEARPARCDRAVCLWGRPERDGGRAVQGGLVDGGDRAGPAAVVPGRARPARQRAARGDAGVDRARRAGRGVGGAGGRRQGGGEGAEEAEPRGTEGRGEAAGDYVRGERGGAWREAGGGRARGAGRRGRAGGGREGARGSLGRDSRSPASIRRHGWSRARGARRSCGGRRGRIRGWPRRRRRTRRLRACVATPPPRALGSPRRCARWTTSTCSSTGTCSSRMCSALRLEVRLWARAVRTT
jgi:hypothetical protein